MNRSWQPLGGVAPTGLVAARLELHYAAQVPAALGIARARPEPDFGHHALAWDGEERALSSALVQGSRPYRAALRLADRTLLLLEERGRGGRGARLESLALDGRTLQDALAWLTRSSAHLSGAAEAPLALPAQELPAHPLVRGARFGPVDAAGAAELERWYSNLERTLAAVGQSGSSSPVRVWSHHFDLDTVLSLGGERTIGLGLSPGDEYYAEPYLYVLPSSVAEGAQPPMLEPPAEWRTRDWTGAVLRGSEITKLPGDAQPAAAERFYRTALAAVRPIVPA